MSDLIRYAQTGYDRGLEANPDGDLVRYRDAKDEIERLPLKVEVYKRYRAENRKLQAKVEKLERGTDPTLQDFAEALAEWSDATFIGQTSAGKLAHLAREVEELREDSSDKIEYADCFMLLIDAWRMDHGHTDGLLLAARMKLEICKAREWGKPNADGSVEHVRAATEQGETDAKS